MRNHGITQFTLHMSHAYSLCSYPNGGNSTNELSFLFHLIRARPANILCLRLSDKSGSTERKSDFRWLDLYLFCVFLVSRRCWLPQGHNVRRKGCDRAPWPFPFLRTILPSFASGEFCFKWKAWPLRAASVCTYSVMRVHITRLHCTHLSPAHLPPLVGPPECSAHGASQRPHAPGATGQPGGHVD